MNRSTLIAIGATIVVNFMSTGLSAQTSAKPSPFQDQKTLTGTAARAMVDGCLAFATKNNMQVTIVVLDSHGDVLDMHRMNSASANAFRTAPLKARAAFFNRVPSKTLEERVAQGNSTSLWIGDFPQHGGIPILADAKVVGSIGVGGGTGAQDDDCAQAGIDSVMTVAK
jgi:glc operon protein GlcG